MTEKTKIFLEKLKNNGKWNDDYDYSKVEYINYSTKITIISKLLNTEHRLSPERIDYGSKCCIQNCTNPNKYIISEFRKVHGDKYDYSLVKYIGVNEKVKIICKNHGVFDQTPNNHKQGNNCQKCVGGVSLTLDKIIEKCKKIHENKYDYSLVKYKNYNTKIKIICSIHNIFEQTLGSHIQGKSGCPKCNHSYGEKFIEKFLVENNINFTTQHKFEDCRYKNPLSFDFYLPKYNLCIEYNGIQHYQPTKWFGVDKFESQVRNDKIKKDYCNDNNIKLLIIPYIEFSRINEILFNIIY